MFFKRERRALGEPRACCYSVSLKGVVRARKQVKTGLRLEPSVGLYLLVLPAGFVCARKSTPANFLLVHEASAHENAPVWGQASWIPEQGPDPGELSGVLTRPALLLWASGHRDCYLHPIPGYWGCLFRAFGQGVSPGNKHLPLLFFLGL